MRRRGLLGTVVALAALPGCSGPGNQVEATGSPATLDAEGYERVGSETITVETTVRASVSGDIQLHGRADVTAHVPVRSYRHGDTVIALASAPAVKPISNHEIYRDPYAELPPAERAGRAQSVYDPADLSESGTRSVRYLDAEATLTSYDASDGDAALVVGLAAVRHGADFVTLVVVRPPDADASLSAVLSGISHEKTDRGE